MRTDPFYYKSQYARAEALCDALQLSREARQEVDDAVSIGIMRAFTETVEGSTPLASSRPLILQRGNPRGINPDREIEVSGEPFRRWIELLPETVQRLSHGDYKRLTELRLMTVEKVVRDLRAEVPFLSEIQRNDRLAIKHLLIALGYSYEDRGAIYQRIAGYLPEVLDIDTRSSI